MQELTHQKEGGGRTACCTNVGEKPGPRKAEGVETNSEVGEGGREIQLCIFQKSLKLGRKGIESSSGGKAPIKFSEMINRHRYEAAIVMEIEKREDWGTLFSPSSRKKEGRISKKSGRVKGSKK